MLSSCNSIIYWHCGRSDKKYERKINRKFKGEYKFRIVDTSMLIISHKDTLKINRSELLEFNPFACCVSERTIIIRLNNSQAIKKDILGITSTCDGYEINFRGNQSRRKIMRASLWLANATCHLQTSK